MAKGDKRRWTEADEELLRESNLSNPELAKILNRTAMSISKKKVRMGIGLKKPRWTDSEETELESKWTWIKKPVIVNSTKRSKIAIKKRGLCLNLGPRYNGGGTYLTTGDVGQILGKNPGVIRQHVLNGRLKAQFYGLKKIAQINPESMLLYMWDNLTELESSKMDWNTIDTYLKTYKVLTEYQIEQLRNKRYEKGC